jgi:hypothetical protein
MKSRTLRLAFLFLVFACFADCTRSEGKRDAGSDAPHASIDSGAPDSPIGIDGGTEAGGSPGGHEAGVAGTGTGGVGGTGGTTGSGGASGSGGTSGGTGDTSGSGGAAGSGSRIETGGTLGSGGGSATGGVVTTSGGAGGGIGSGGGVRVGGIVGFGGVVGLGGNPGVGGTVGAGGSGGASALDAGLDGDIDTPVESEAGTVDSEENPQDTDQPTLDASDGLDASDIDTAVANVDAGVPMVGCLYEGTYTIPSLATTRQWQSSSCSYATNQQATTVNIVAADGKLQTELTPILTFFMVGQVPQAFPNWTITTNTTSRLTATGGIYCGTYPLWISSSFTLDVDCQTGAFTVNGSCEADWPSAPPCLMSPDFRYTLNGSVAIACSGRNPPPVWCDGGDAQ